MVKVLLCSQRFKVTSGSAMQENQHAMDLIAKLDLEKAQLQRARSLSPSSIAAKSLSPGQSLYKAFGQGNDSTTIAELQSQLELEKAQRQQVECCHCMTA